MYVTRHTNVTDPAVLNDLWALYNESYDRMSAADVTRETLFRSEFDDVLADPTNRVWVVRDENRPVSMAVIATDIASTRYLSRAYFDRTNPQRMSQGLVHYIMWVVTHPTYQRGAATFELAQSALAQESQEGALLVFDLPESNQPEQEGGGAEMFLRIARTVGPVNLEAHGGSRYFALDFAAVEQSAVDAPATASNTGSSDVERINV